MDRDALEWALRAPLPIGDHRAGQQAIRVVLMALVIHANEDGHAWPSADRLTRLIGGSNSWTVRSCIVILRECGLISPAGRVGRANRWLLNVEPPAAENLRDDLRNHPSDDPSDHASDHASDITHQTEEELKGTGGTTSLEPDVKLSTLKPVRPRRVENLTLSEFSPVAVDRFPEFWAIYPRREAKFRAVKAWNVATKTTGPGEIIAGACRYRDDPNREEQFTAHPATWLNAGRWSDDPQPARQQPNGAQRVSTADQRLATALSVAERLDAQERNALAASASAPPARLALSADW